ncbi:MAG: sensor histidine kinase [Acidimicrobiales bacterium]
MSSGAELLRFAAEFATFLVAGACLALIAMRPGLLVADGGPRLIVGTGFFVLGTTAFVSGASLIDDPDAAAVVVFRLLALALLVALPLAWRGGSPGSIAATGGLLLLAMGEVFDLVDRDVEADWVRLGGALFVGAGALLAARRSIPARIATSASAILLTVVLAVSVGLSAVISDNVEREAERRLAARAATEAELARSAGEIAQQSVDLAARVFSDATALAQLTELSTQPTPNAALQSEVQGNLRSLTESVLLDFDPRVGPTLLLRAVDRQPLASVTANGVPPDPVVEAEMIGSNVVTEAINRGSSTQSTITTANAAYGLAAAPIQVRSEGALFTAAVVVVSSQLDATYLEARYRQGGGETDDLAYVLRSRSGTVAAHRAEGAPAPPEAAVAELAAAVLDGEPSATRTTSGSLLVAGPVTTPTGAPVLALVTAQPTAVIQETRADLFRLLFVIALAATGLALVLTSVVGERIGSGLRRLTAAAGEVTTGNLLVTADVRSDDELGVLSSAFDSMTGSLRTMTAELRQAADDEVRLRTRLEAVVGGMGEALVAVDDRGDITDFNAAAELLTGVPARKAVGRPAALIVRLVAEDGTDVTTRFGAPVEESWAAAATVLHATGVEVPVIVSAGPLRGASNQAAGAVYVLRDVRREREMERMKSEFLANISHELRTPLSPIKGYSQILRRRVIPGGDVQRFATEIERGADKLERVVDQLVNFAAMSAGRFEVRTEPVLVREVLDRAVARWSDRVDPDRFSLTRRVARKVPKIWLDRRAIEQALDELVDNAIKYSPTGGRIDLTATLEERAAQAFVRLSVTDRGIGIPADRLDTVLEDFTQADGSITRTFGGLGLGLTLVSRIARAHGGDVELSSVEGKGTQVSMLLPATEPASGR